MKSRARIEGAKRMLCYYMPPNPALQLTRAARGALGRARQFDEQNRSIEVVLRRGQVNTKPLARDNSLVEKQKLYTG